MKKNLVLSLIAILVGIFLTFTQVWAAAPEITTSKKTPPPDNPGVQQVVPPGQDKPKNENKGGKPENPPGQVKDKDKPEKPEKPGQAKGKNHPVVYRGSINSITPGTQAQDAVLTILLKTGETVDVLVPAETVIFVPTLKKTGSIDLLAAGMEVVVKTHLPAADASAPADAGPALPVADTIHLIPAAPLHIHNNGKVAAYVAYLTGVNGSITLEKGQVFLITAETKIIGAEALAGFSPDTPLFVTIISVPGEAGASRTATGIVVHPAK